MEIETNCRETKRQTERSNKGDGTKERDDQEILSLMMACGGVEDRCEEDCKCHQPSRVYRRPVLTGSGSNGPPRWTQDQS